MEMSINQALLCLRIENKSFVNLYDVKKSYKKIMKEIHPDIGGNVEEAKRVNEAYRVLKSKVESNGIIYTGIRETIREEVESVPIREYLRRKDLGGNLKVNLLDWFVFYIDGFEVYRKVFSIPFEFGRFEYHLNVEIRLGNTTPTSLLSIKDSNGCFIKKDIKMYPPFQVISFEIGQFQGNINIKYKL